MGPPPAYGWGYQPQPPRRRRWPLIVGIVAAVLLVAGLGVGGWAYGTGRLGFGPLSAQDKAAARVIAARVDAPSWADNDQRSCAATALLKHHRSGDLAHTGLIKKGGEDGWTFTGDWEVADARTYADGVLACSSDWKQQLGDEWHLDDTDCLDHVGRSTVADTLVTTELRLDSSDAVSVHDDAAAKLDDCYGSALDAVTGTAKPADRAVDFELDAPDAPNAETTLKVDGPDGEQTVAGTSYHAETTEGGKRVCIDVSVEAHYAWGSTESSPKTHLCGRAAPKRLWWTRLPHCVESDPGCITWGLHAEGFATGTATLLVSSPAGDCPLASNECRKLVLIGSDGHGIEDGMVLTVTGGPGRRQDDIIARIGRLTARLHP